MHERTEVTHLPAHRLSRLGVNYVPETRRIFPNLGVEENQREVESLVGF